MKLWLLKPQDDLPAGNPWDPWYDKCFGLVIRAETERKARNIAQREHGLPDSAWTNPKWSSCVELTAAGEVGVILYDNHNA